jgi:cellulose synthase/poly-beta-1,6-N-acetylglucosamine synthase-like glycosyltransferase
VGLGRLFHAQQEENQNAMLLIEVVAAMMAVSAVVPALLFALNMRRYRLPRFGAEQKAPVAVLIPARDEEKNIGACLESVLASREVDLEVLVLDDDSADRTVNIVLDMAARDSRVKLLQSSRLPSGWTGKQYACWQLAQGTDAPVMLFLDADVRVKPWAIARSLAALRKRKVTLLSGFPRPIAAGVFGKMLLAMRQYLLLAFLPFGRMQKTTTPAYAAGCGQFMLVDREAYIASGGHAAIRQTRHDGVMLPRLFREHSLRTDIVDLSMLAEAEMFRARNAGLAKTATEGIGIEDHIVTFTAVLLLGQVLPVIAACWWLLKGVSMIAAGRSIEDPAGLALVTLLIVIALVASYAPRMVAARRFKQSTLSALLHPLEMLLMLVVQWIAFARTAMGWPVIWRAREYPV